MELTRKQEEGLKIALERHKNNEKYTTIAGYAGTGKSTLVKFIINALQMDPTKVAYATFTGKAAEVLRKKGNPNAMTLHRLLYDSIPKSSGGFIRVPKKTLDYTIIVVDEVSIVPKSMIDMLLAHRVYVIFLGDPFQLPQIDKNEGHDLLDHPHIFLDEVMRQAAESEIIRLTMTIRAGEPIKFTEGKEIIVIPNSQLVTGHLKWADQMICGTNAARVSLNEQMRALLGFEGLPQSGERLICLRNYWEDIDEMGEACIVNGTTGKIENPYESFIMAPRYIKMNNHRIDIIKGEFISDDGHIFSVDMDKKMLETGEFSLDWRESYALGKIKNKIGDIVPRQFTYGYAITCWKAQGSEWDKVLAIEERFPYNKLEHQKFLYTACTRASKKLVLVRE